jgi:DNA-binding transcriptional ArsR family regulator
LLTDSQLQDVASRFRLLGEPMRLKILQAVCKKPLSVTEIVEAVDATQANVSKHLALLAAGGVLERRKDGQCVYYGMKDPLVLQLCMLVHREMDK